LEQSSECDIFCISGGKVKAGDNAFYHDIIHIPPLPPSRLDGCNIIDVHYAIKVIPRLAQIGFFGFTKKPKISRKLQNLSFRPIGFYIFTFFSENCMFRLR